MAKRSSILLKALDSALVRNVTFSRISRDGVFSLFASYTLLCGGSRTWAEKVHVTTFGFFLKTKSEGRQQVSRFSKGKRFFVAIFKLPLFRQKVFVLRLRKFIFREQALRFPLHYHFQPVPICVAGRRTRGGRGAGGNRVIAAD